MNVQLLIWRGRFTQGSLGFKEINSDGVEFLS